MLSTIEYYLFIQQIYRNHLVANNYYFKYFKPVAADAVVEVF